jgi:hypothetical protein
LALLASGALFGGTAQSAVAAEASCPNEALRIQSNVNPTTLLPFSSGLTECRAYEMVSPVDKQAHDARESRILSRDGKSVNFNIFGQLRDGEGFNTYNFTGNTFLAQRSDAGWATRATTMAGAAIQKSAGTPLILDYSSDFSRYAGCGSQTSSGAGANSNAVCAVHLPSGWVSSPIYRTLNSNASEIGGVLYEGGSADLSHVVFIVTNGFLRLLPTDNFVSTDSSSIYEVAGLGTDSPTLRLVNLDSNGSQMATSNQGLALGFGGTNGGDSYQAVSDDGNTIYFTATPIGGSVQTIFARRNGATTTAISNPSPSECTTCNSAPSAATYQGASADGSKVFFLTNQQLVNADTDTTQDLYQYDFENSVGHRIVQVSGGGTGDLTPGSGANVSGVVRTSEDGSHAYFVATGVLTTLPNGNGQTATAGASNLYMFERDAAHPVGLTKFVTTLPSGEPSSALWSTSNNLFRRARTNPDGSVMVFATSAALRPDDLDTAIDIYRYDSSSGKLNRVSIGEPAFPASNNGNTPGKDAQIVGITGFGQFGSQADVNQRSNPISDDGSYVTFTTPEQLQADDVNGVSDIYLWHEGTVSMISDGRDATYANGIESEATSMSASGADIVFGTRTKLLPQDDDELVDVYDAKVDGGLLYTPPPPLCGSVEACHGPASAAPTSAAAGTGTFSGPANPAPEKPAKKKHKKKKHHKKQHPKKHSTGKRR